MSPLDTIKIKENPGASDTAAGGRIDCHAINSNYPLAAQA
jgi:hypothetical protein